MSRCSLWNTLAASRAAAERPCALGVRIFLITCLSSAAAASLWAAHGSAQTTLTK